MKIRTLLKELNVLCNPDDSMITPIELNMYLKQYEEKEGISPEDAKTGKGIRLTRQQKLVIYGYERLNGLIEYEEKEIICVPNRNSYYKTDKDVTAMALKEDYYSGHGSKMKAAYNVQFIVSVFFMNIPGIRL